MVVTYAANKQSQDNAYAGLRAAEVTDDKSAALCSLGPTTSCWLDQFYTISLGVVLTKTRIIGVQRFHYLIPAMPSFGRHGFQLMKEWLKESFTDFWDDYTIRRLFSAQKCLTLLNDGAYGIVNISERHHALR